MLLYESDLYKQAQLALETSFGLRQIFEFLPEHTEISISLDERIPCTLKLIEKKLILAPEKATNADFHIVLLFESVRRLQAQNFETLVQFVGEMVEQIVLGYAKVTRLTELKRIREKGYFNVMKKIAPEFQSKIIQKLSKFF